MALTMPSGTLTTVSTGTISRQFGTYSMTMEFNSSSAATLTMKMSKLPVMEQKIDLQVEAQDLSDIKVNLSDIEFTVFDGLSDGTSLIDRISSLDVGQAIKITSTVNSGNDYFLATRSTCKYDWESRSVTIKAVSPFRYDNTISSYDPSSYQLVGATESWIFPKDLITAFLDSQGSTGSSIVLGTYFNYSIVGTLPASLGDKLAFFYPNVDSSNYGTAQDVCLKLAVMEGAYMGTLFGTKYYVRRNHTDIATTPVYTYADINADDIESYELITNERSVRNYDTLFVFQDQFGNPSVPTTHQVSQVVSSFGAFDVNLDYRFDDVSERPEAIFYSVPFSQWQPSTNANSQTLINSLNSSIEVSSREAYASALGIAQSNNISYNQMFNVKLTLFGIESFLPYQFICFATGINPFLDNRKLRPSSVKYNLEQNKVEVEGYFIG